MPPIPELLRSLANEYEQMRLQIATLTSQAAQLTACSDITHASAKHTRLGNASSSCCKHIDSTPICRNITVEFFTSISSPRHMRKASLEAPSQPIVHESCPEIDFEEIPKLSSTLSTEDFANELDKQATSQPIVHESWPEIDVEETQNPSSKLSAEDFANELDKETSSAIADPQSRRAHLCGSCNGRGCPKCNDEAYRTIPAWEDDGLPTRRKSEGSLTDHLDGWHSQIKVGAEMRSLGCMQKAVSRPGSVRFVVWDLSAFFIIAYDLVVLPLQAFDLQATKFSIAMSYAKTFFWTIDMFLSFTRGFHSGVSIEMRPEKIAKKYLKSWFCLDLVVTAIDWFFILCEVSALANFFGFAKGLKGSRLIEVVRMLRLFRIVKLLALLDDFAEFIRSAIYSEVMKSVLAILNLIVMIVVANHFLACGWYAVGIVDTNHNTWMKHLEAVNAFEASFGWYYSSALHWSITQFTPASMEIVPRNMYERIYAICVILFALVAFSSFVSSITSAMAHIRAARSEETKQEKQLHRYITENSVSLELGKRILGFLKEYRRTFRTRVHECDVPVLRALPAGARMQLHSEIFSPILTTHPLFDRLAEVESSCLAKICHYASKELTLTCGQELCSPGQQASHMYFIGSGQVAPAQTSDDCDIPTVGPGDYLCEMSLWVHWTHQDLMVAKVNSELVAMNSDSFQAVALKSNSLAHFRKYAKLFVERLNATFCGTLVHPSDTWGSGESSRLTTYGFAQCAFTNDSEAPPDAEGTGERRSSRTLGRQLTSMTIVKVLAQSLTRYSSFSTLSRGTSSSSNN